MDVEYGVKIARPAQDIPYHSFETETAYVVLLQLSENESKGVELRVSDDGTELHIHGGGNKSTYNHVLARRVRLSREEQVGRFRKVFSIPEDVDTRGIKAEYDENSQCLVIYIPKLVATPAAGGEDIKDEEGQDEGNGESPPKSGGRETTPELVESGEEVPVGETLALEEQMQTEEVVTSERGEEESPKALSPREPEPSAAEAPADKRQLPEATPDSDPTPPPEDLKSTQLPADPEVEGVRMPMPGNNEPEPKVTALSPPPEHPAPELQTQLTPENEEDVQTEFDVALVPPPIKPEPEAEDVQTPLPEVEEIIGIPTPPPEDPEPELELVQAPPQEHEPNPPPDRAESERKPEVLAPGPPEEAQGSAEPPSLPEESTVVEEARENESEDGEEGASGRRRGRRRRRRLPIPTSPPFLLGGSVFFFSVLALAFHVLRQRSRRRQR